MPDAAIRALRHTLRRLERLVASQLKESGGCGGVSLPQCHALLEIEAAEPLGLQELAQRLGLDKSTLSRTVDSLVTGGLVARRIPPRDRRSVQLALTPQGRDTCLRINRTNDALFTRVVAHLPPARREEVLKGFDTLVDAMAAEMGAQSRLCCPANPEKGDSP